MDKEEVSKNYLSMPTLDIKNKLQVDFWTRHWGVSVHQLRAAVRGANSDRIKRIEEYLKDKKAI